MKALRFGQNTRGSSIRRVASILVVAGTLAGLGIYHGNSDHVDARRSDEIRIAAVAYVGSCPLLMADAEGYLTDEGVAAKITFEANGRDALNLVLRGEADLATAADIPIMYAALAGEPISVIATMTSMEDHAIVGRRDRGVVSPASLRGKRVGISLGTTTQFYLDAFLNRQLMSAADVTVVDMRPTDLLRSVVGGDLDAAVLYQPFLNVSVAQTGPWAIVLSGEAVYDVLFNLASTRTYVSERTRVVEKLLRATIRGARFCRDFPEKASERLAGLMGEDPSGVKEIWPSYDFEIALRQGLLLTLEDEARWAIRNNLTTRTNVPNFLDNIAQDPLRAASRSAVTVIR